MNYLRIISDDFVGTSGITNESPPSAHQSVRLFNIFIIFHKNAFLSESTDEKHTQKTEPGGGEM